MFRRLSAKPCVSQTYTSLRPQQVVISRRAYTSGLFQLTTDALVYGGISVMFLSGYKSFLGWHTYNNVYKKIEHPYNELTSKILPRRAIKYGTEWNPVSRTFKYADQLVYVNETIPVMIKSTQENRGPQAALRDLQATVPGIEDRLVVIGTIDKSSVVSDAHPYSLKPCDEHAAILSDPDTYESSVYIRQTFNEASEYNSKGFFLSMTGCGMQLAALILECML